VSKIEFLKRHSCGDGDSAAAPTRPAIWSAEAALAAEFERIDAAVPASGKWRPITDSTAPDRGGFNVARIGEDR
jgi:hypothetical protein